VAGCAGLVKLGVHLQGFSNVSPRIRLTTWLFERSNYLLPIFNTGHSAAQQQLVSIYQLSKACGEGGLSRRHFLERVRRIEALNEDTAYRAISFEATHMDAILVM
jgi:DNA helicase-2/ATP-dependent DNA helicase PcrA